MIVDLTARLTLNPDRLVPSLKRIHDELTLGSMSGELRVLAADFEAATGLSVVRRDGMELFEFVMRRGLLMGGADLNDYFEAEIMDHLLHNTAIFTTPTAVFLALFTTATSDAEGGTEVANSNGYARKSVATNGAEWSGAGSGASENNNDIDFAAASGGNWGTVTHIAVVSSGTYGAADWFFHGALTASKVINDGDTARVNAGDLDLAVA